MIIVSVVYELYQFISRPFQPQYYLPYYVTILQFHVFPSCCVIGLGIDFGWYFYILTDILIGLLQLMKILLNEM